MSDYSTECPACLAELDDVRETLDGGECVECGSDLSVIYALKDGVLTREELEQAEYGTEYFIPAEKRNEIRERVEAREDPAEAEVVTTYV